MQLCNVYSTKALWRLFQYEEDLSICRDCDYEDVFIIGIPKLVRLHLGNETDHWISDGLKHGNSLPSG